MSSNIVYQYVWRDYSLPAHKGWILTLKDNEAIAFLAMVTTLVAYTQSRFWVILYDVFDQFTTAGIQLPVPRERPSQSKAIKILIGGMKRRRRQGQPTNTFPGISPWIGVLAITNIIVCLTLGIVLPWRLSGGMETPIVRSKETDGCIGIENRIEAILNSARLGAILYQKCWYNISQDKNPCGRSDGILNDRPALWVSRMEVCPFSGNACQNQSAAIRLEHRGLLPRQYGVNSKSPILINRRLTCSSLETASFIRSPMKDGTTWLAFLDFDRPDWLDYLEDYATKLSTLNGPNKYSREQSGRRVALDNGRTDFQVWPFVYYNHSDTLRKLDPRLRRNDGTVFIVGLRAGRSYYEYPMDDPFFSAHVPLGDSMFFPDFEITALGCMEQHQFCINKPGIFCTPWHNMGDPDNINLIWQRLIDNSNLQVDDLLNIHFLTQSQSPVQDHLHIHKGTKALMSFQHRGAELFRDLHPKEQWIIELTAWFETTLLQARYQTLGLIERELPIQGLDPKDLQSKKIHGKFCNQVLFFDGNYTNIDFVQLLVTLFCLIGVCLLSIRKSIVTRGNKLGKICWKSLKIAYKACSRGVEYLVGKCKLLHWPRITFPRIVRRPTEQQPSSRAYPRNPFRNPRNDRRAETPIIRPEDVSLQNLDPGLGDNISNFVVEVTNGNA